MLLIWEHCLGLLDYLTLAGTPVHTARMALRHLQKVMFTLNEE